MIVQECEIKFYIGLHASAVQPHFIQ